MEALQSILQHKIIAIMRGVNLDDVIAITSALNEGGIKNIEVTLNTNNALLAIESLRSKFGKEINIGAGTVLDAESAKAAIHAGAEFIISPVLNFETIKLTKRYGKVSIPAGFTPTEILTAYESGADLVKVFPVSSVGPAYIKDIQGPLPQVPLIPTGGVNIENVSAYLKNGASAVGLGGSLVPSNFIANEENLHRLTALAKQFVEKTAKY